MVEDDLTLGGETIVFVRDEKPLNYPGLRRDLKCPDCKAPMVLKKSKFGLFYGCSAFHETGCRGSHKAMSDGSPAGIPGDAATRRARKEILLLREQVQKHPDGAARQRAQAALDARGKSIAAMSQEECEKLAYRVRWELGEINRFSRELPYLGDD